MSDLSVEIFFIELSYIPKIYVLARSIRKRKESQYIKNFIVILQNEHSNIAIEFFSAYMLVSIFCDNFSSALLIEKKFCSIVRLRKSVFPI